MPDLLSGINTSNSKSKTLHARLVHIDVTEPTKTMTVFTARAVTANGNYTIAEATLYGDQASKTQELKNLKQKFVEGGAYSFQNMTMKRKSDKHHGSPHGYVLNIGAKNSKCTVLKAEDAGCLPHFVEPPMSISELTSFSSSQVIDFTAYVLAVGEPVTKKNNKQLQVLTLVDESKTTMQWTFWDDMIARVPENVDRKVVHVFGAYLVVDDEGTKHIAPRKHTKTVVAQGTEPLAMKILAAGVSTIEKDDEGLTHLSKIEKRDFMACPAIEGNVSMVAACKSLKENEEIIIEVLGAMVTLESTDDLVTRDGERIYARVSVTDRTDTVNANLLHSPALALSNCKDKEVFLDTAAKGTLSFARGRLRILRTLPGDDKNTKLLIVAAVPRLAEVPSLLPCTPSDDRILASTLSCLQASATGKLSVTMGGDRCLASGALALVQAIREADTVLMEPEKYGIKNYIRDVAAADDSTEYTGVTSALMSRLNRYALFPPAMAMIHITGFQEGALVVGDIWPLSATSDIEQILKTFQVEIEGSKKILEVAKKRKWDSSMDIFESCKKNKKFDDAFA